MESLKHLLSKEDMLWLLGSLCQIHSKLFEVKLIMQQFTPPYDITTFKQAARDLDFETELHEKSCLSIKKPTFPGVAFLKQDSTAKKSLDTNNDSSESETATIKPILVIRKNDEQVIYFAAGEQSPTTVSLNEFEQQVHNAYISIKDKLPPH